MVGTVLVKSLLVGAAMAALASLPVQAQVPRDWFLLTPTADCVRAAYALPKWPTPLAFHIGLRNKGTTDSLEKLPNGGINLKIVGTPGDGMFWYPDRASCLIAQAIVKRAGEPETKDLM